MKIAREWSTPLIIGSFAVLSVTGVLMFFHLDTGLNKVVHEWLSWVLLAAAGFHVASNYLGFKRYFGMARARWMIGGSLLVLVLSFVPVATQAPPWAAPVNALAAAPVSTLAQVAGVSADDMRRRLAAAGLKSEGEASIRELAGPNRRRQIEVLSKVLAQTSEPRADGQGQRRQEQARGS